MSDPSATIRDYLVTNGIEFDEVHADSFLVVLPGERKHRTTVSLVIGDHAVSINAFVMRRPDENHMAVYRWLLERNRRMYAIAYALDHLGDIYLVGRINRHVLTSDELDRVLGTILENADGHFNALLEMGFESAIRREWAWRESRGESLANLEAFRHLVNNPEPGSAG